MQRNALLFIVLFLSINFSYSQEFRFDHYTNELLFNVMTEKPDSSLTEFLNRCLPNRVYTSPSNTFPQNDTKQFNEEIHTYLFKQHPYLEMRIAEGGLDLICKNHTGKSPSQQIEKARLWFSFDQQIDAERGFGRLVENYILLSNVKKFSASNGTQNAEFLDTLSKKGFNKVLFKMSVDNLGPHRFKIMLETENAQ